jgi:hypothetical protein
MVYHNVRHFALAYNTESTENNVRGPSKGYFGMFGIHHLLTSSLRPQLEQMTCPTLSNGDAGLNECISERLHLN